MNNDENRTGKSGSGQQNAPRSALDDFREEPVWNEGGPRSAEDIQSNRPPQREERDRENAQNLTKNTGSSTANAGTAGTGKSTRSSGASSASRTKSSGSQTKKNGSTARATNAERAKGEANSGSRSGGNRSSDQSGQNKRKREKVDLENKPRSSGTVHKILPYVFLGVAILVAVCLILNLVCNRGNRCADNPSAHLMGSVGYYICYGLFGMFGPAVFALPFLLLNMAFFWKTYVDHKLVVEKTIASVLFLIFFSTMIHVFCLIRLVDEGRETYFTANQLITLVGVKMTGGGLIGGGIGYFLYSIFNLIGATIVSVILTAFSVFFFLGMTPQHLWERIRAKRALKKADRVPLGADEEAPIREQMRRKHERAAAKTADPYAEEYGGKDIRSGAPAGAVRHVRPSADDSDENGLAPMPMPVLDATDEIPPNRPLYVPEEVGKEMKEKEKAGVSATSDAPARARVDEPVLPAQTSKEPDASQPMRSPVPPLARSRDEASSVDTIFPRSAESGAVRKVQKSDRGFELGNIFIDLEDHPQPQVKKHAPLPPEVPMPGGGVTKNAVPASDSAGNGGQPARPGSSARPPVRPAPAAGKAPAGGPAGGKPPVPGKPPAAGQKTVFRPAEKSDQQEFGLSDAEFEQREAETQSISRAIGSKKQSAAPVKTPAPVKNPVKDAPKTASETSKPYIFPPISYLHPGEPMSAENRAEIEGNMRVLSNTLENFRVSVSEITYSCGPTVTRYEIFPSPGVRVRNIVNLADDIALAFAVQGVRMETIEGKSAIGVEVPNKSRCTVYLRDLLESKKFTDSSSRLTAGLGADVTGTPLHFDIAKMPHLLVAGTTGSGKSICINCIIMSILFKARPDEVKLILIDPKKVEFSLYKGIPHLMAPIILTPKDAAGALQAAVEEMEDRFSKIQDVGVHDIAGYNKMAEKDPDLTPMPHVVIIIDELADLMMTARDEVEDSICRLAQKARAAGMHIIVGTQRPSVDVVTGLIKSNIPSRIACTVRSQVDSRTILDFAGAEKLLGRGDMLFAPIGSMKPTRVQGAFVADAEVEKICEFIRATNGTARYNENFTSKMKEYSAQCGNKKGKGESESDVSLPAGEGGDNKYVDAIRISIEEKRVSTSLLQRKLGIGYSRAAKIIDRMEEEGLVSKPDGSKPRNILITAEQFIERYVDGNAGGGEDL